VNGTHFSRAAWWKRGSFHHVMNYYLSLVATISVFTYSAIPQASAHCQVPCGIYSDDTVLTDLQTHQKTIAKAMSQINELSKNPAKHANQIARWVTNKEEHATTIQNTMCQYFLAQRLKLDEQDNNKNTYLKKVVLVHKIIVLSMKCKQTTDAANAQALHDAINEFTKAYNAKK